jgi:hypothetical protein
MSYKALTCGNVTVGGCSHLPGWNVVRHPELNQT